MKIKLKHCALAVVCILLWYAGIQAGLAFFFDEATHWAAIPWDLSAHLAIGLLLYAITRSPGWFAVIYGVFTAVIHFSNAAKLKFFGTPIMPDDLVSVRNLFMLFEGWQLAILIAVVVCLLALFLFLTLWRARHTWLIFLFLALTLVALSYNPVRWVQAMDNQFGNVIWNQRGNYRDRGLLIHLCQEWLRQLGRRSAPPTAEEVHRALAVIHRLDYSTPGTEPATLAGNRNVHIIVLESFWDPTALKNIKFSSDPVDGRFRELWRQTGYSHVLSPVWGGRTANAEFEALCGFPVTRDNVVFEGWLSNEVPCLPAYLTRRGYRTVVSHPNFAAFWNRVNSYRRLGFEHYWAKPDFVLDDMNKNILGDASFYRQLEEKLAAFPVDGRPLFNYALTFFGHYPYSLNNSRPPVIEISPKDELIRNYANTIYYKSRELMDFLERLRARDPNALIVVFGDHLPFLGLNFEGFTDSGLLAENISEFTEEMFAVYTRAPLVIIDGQRGPLRSGDVPLYALPSRILGNLNDTSQAMVRMVTQPEGVIVRPLPEMYYLETAQGRAVCRNETETNPDCRSTRDWVRAVNVLSDDLFRGKQFSLVETADVISH
jgi:phosphoglycerol transferase MdoB-like AlkP superfamily enzyme